MTKANKIAGSGLHSHEVPTVPLLVVEMRDGGHSGTAVYLRENGDYVFVDYDTERVSTAERVVLLVGEDQYVHMWPYAMDLESPRGLALVGVDLDDPLDCLSEGAEVLWDSHARPHIVIAGSEELEAGLMVTLEKKVFSDGNEWRNIGTAVIQWVYNGRCRVGLHVSFGSLVPTELIAVPPNEDGEWKCLGEAGVYYRMRS